MKNKFLKIITAVLLLALTVCAFAACGEKDNGDSDKNTDKSSFAVKYNGETVALGADATAVVKKIGDPKSKQATGNCGGQGETVRYDYSSFILVVVEYESGAKIDQIEIRNDLVETTGGVTIGSSESAVKNAYGEPSETKNTTLVYKNGKQRMNVGIEDGYVSFLTMKIEG